VRISAKVDYAVRAMAQLAADESGEPVKADHLAREQGIPPKFLLAILHELKGARLVRSQRGLSGGFVLGGPPDRITVADIIRALDGPLANVRDTSIEELFYVGPARGCSTSGWRCAPACGRCSTA
jgi:Rrf2 family protein